MKHSLSNTKILLSLSYLSTSESGKASLGTYLYLLSKAGFLDKVVLPGVSRLQDGRRDVVAASPYLDLFLAV